MKPTILLLATLAVSVCQMTNAQTAREYFNELYQAGGLDRMADGYACFDDSSDLQTFFIYGESEVVKQFLESKGEFAKLSKDQQEQLNKGFLIIRGYDKGVTVGDEVFYRKDGSSWVTDPFKSVSSKLLMRIRFTVTLQTLRYRRSVEILNPDLSLKTDVSRYGRCEEISPTVQQKGNP